MRGFFCLFRGVKQKQVTDLLHCIALHCIPFQSFPRFQLVPDFDPKGNYSPQLAARRCVGSGRHFPFIKNLPRLPLTSNLTPPQALEYLNNQISSTFQPTHTHSSNLKTLQLQHTILNIFPIHLHPSPPSHLLYISINSQPTCLDTAMTSNP